MKTKTYAEYKKEQRGKTQSNSNYATSCVNNHPVQLSKYSSTTSHKKQQLIPPGSLGTLTKATYERLKLQPQHRRMGPTTSALVRPAPLFSRPPPGAALRVMPPKKRVKLDEDEDDEIDKKKTDDTNKSTKPFLVNPYAKVKDRKLEERNRRESQRKPIRSQSDSEKLPSKLSSPNIMRLAEGSKSTTSIDKSKKSLPKTPRTLSRSAMAQRSTLPQRSSLPPKSQLPQKSSLNQRSPLPQRSTLPQRSSLNQRSPIPQRSTLSPRSSISHRSSNRNAFPIKRSHHQVSQKRQSNNAQERICNNMDQTKQPTFLGVKFKRMKKANLADQIKRSKEGKLDLMTPDSILTSVHIKDLLNESTFKTLPPAYQYQLLMLLPECDREMGSDGALRLSQHALNNEFFTRSCQEFKDKLMDGEFNSDIIQRAKNEVELSTKLDPWKVKYFEPVYGALSSSDDARANDVAKANDPPPQVPPRINVVQSSWVAFLKFSENSTDDFEEALAKMQVAVKKAAQNEVKENDSIRCTDITNRTLAQTRSVVFRSPSSLKTKNVMRAETATKEKSRKALKKAQLLQRKKAFDKQLKDAKAKIVEEARSSSRKEEDTLLCDLLKAKLPTYIHGNEDLDYKRPINNTDTEINNLAENPSKLYCPTSDFLFTNTIEPNKTGNDSSKVINLCDNMALKNLIKNSDIIKQNNDIKQNSSDIKPINNFVPQIKRGPNRKRTCSKIIKGPSSFLTNPEGLCPCNLKAMAMCVQCESYWHGDCINGEQLCILCT